LIGDVVNWIGEMAPPNGPTVKAKVRPGCRDRVVAAGHPACRRGRHLAARSALDCVIALKSPALPLGRMPSSTAGRRPAATEKFRLVAVPPRATLKENHETDAEGKMSDLPEAWSLVRHIVRSFLFETLQAGRPGKVVRRRKSDFGAVAA